MISEIEKIFYRIESFKKSVLRPMLKNIRRSFIELKEELFYKTEDFDAYLGRSFIELKDAHRHFDRISHHSVWRSFIELKALSISRRENSNEGLMKRFIVVGWNDHFVI